MQYPGRMAVFSSLNLALQKIPGRAERQEGLQLHQTFVDCGIAEIIDTTDHQILYGRRGTGKTHAFGYLASEVTARGDLALNIDLRKCGSSSGIFSSGEIADTQRATHFLVDMLGNVRDALLEAVIENSDLVEDGNFIDKVDKLLAAITNVRVAGEVELTSESHSSASSVSAGTINASLAPAPEVSINLASKDSATSAEMLKETRRGTQTLSINFSDVARALRDLAKTLRTSRIWLLLDEWSSIPIELQPYLAEFIKRCILPLSCFTVKMAAIEQRSNFSRAADGVRIGLELGADAGSTINLDDFMVYEDNEEKSRSFFVNLFFKHLSDQSGPAVFDESPTPADVIRQGFTEPATFNELVRAAEGVPRDALYIAAAAARQASMGKISMPIVRRAAREWYIADKSRVIEGIPEAANLLQWIIDEVIRGKRARAFLVNKNYSRDPLLYALFDARVLHLIRSGYSAQDKPGERYDVWVIDYGAYVDLIHTQYDPQNFLNFDDDDSEELYGTLPEMEVPTQDLRPIRRAILDLEYFYYRPRGIQGPGPVGRLPSTR